MSPFVTAGGSGTGTGVVSVDVAANSGAARTGTIEIAGQPVTIAQAAAPTDPTAPANLLAAVTGTTVQLTWRPPALGTPTAYVIEAGSSPGASNLAALDTGSTATMFTTAAPIGMYYVRVRARVGSAVGGASNEVVVNVTGACVAPSTPGGLTHTVNGSAVQLSWQAAAGASSYVLEAGSTPGASSLVASDLGNVTTLGALAGPGTYYVRVRAVNTCGPSAPSNEVVVVVAGCAPTLAPALPGATVSNGTVSVSWGAVAGATGYLVEAGLAPGATDAGVFQTSGTSLAGAAPPGRYYIRVRARNDCGVGPVSSEIAIEVP
jgi:predicted phage tail protein